MPSFAMTSYVTFDVSFNFSGAPFFHLEKTDKCCHHDFELKKLTQITYCVSPFIHSSKISKAKLYYLGMNAWWQN